MTDQEIAEYKAEVDRMTHVEMARLWRFARPGHPLFNTMLPLHEYFKERFDSLGGMTPEVSKEIGFVR